VKPAVIDVESDEEDDDDEDDDELYVDDELYEDDDYEGVFGDQELNGKNDEMINENEEEEEREEIENELKMDMDLDNMDEGPRYRKVRIPDSANKATATKSKQSLDSLNSLYQDDGDDKIYASRVAIATEVAKRMKKNEEFVSFNKGAFTIPASTYNQLFDHQKTGIRWLWELHQQNTGGIIADEMGLGKTITVTAFLSGLHFSKKLNGPILIACPASIMTQWVHELHLWSPNFRVIILHSSGTHKHSIESLIKKVQNNNNAILVTTYEGLKNNVYYLKALNWSYMVLDEGHKLRNPDANITITCKQFSTPHRLIVTGEPIQNNLTELWSIFDFVFPGKLGTLPAFQKQFSDPISRGGYANASPLEVQTAYQCAIILRNLISPYFLRRMKSNVNVVLTNKTEQVLFCHLTEKQANCYKTFLMSNECKMIYQGKLKCLYGITILRKICNHTYLLQKSDRLKVSLMNAKETREMVDMSGKLMVLQQILPVWKKQGHKVLIFTQTVQMLNILEQFIAMSGYNYKRMDGNTIIKSRALIIKEFNDNDDIFVFLLTTKVGGIGVNLTGADRVIIFDPDWNPSTDAQARERTWRIGQKRDVTVYRLITKGTIEEKIYHRQIWKQFLSSKVLSSNLSQTRSVFEMKGLENYFI